METIKTAIEEMRHVVDPYPGRGFVEQPVQRVTPDVSVEQDSDGNWTVKLIDEYTPELRISKRYINMLRNNPDAVRRSNPHLPTAAQFVTMAVQSIMLLLFCSTAIQMRFCAPIIIQGIKTVQTKTQRNANRQIGPIDIRFGKMPMLKFAHI